MNRPLAVCLILLASYSQVEGGSMGGEWMGLRLDLMHGDVSAHVSAVADCPDASYCVLGVGHTAQYSEGGGIALSSVSGLGLQVTVVDHSTDSWYAFSSLLPFYPSQPAPIVLDFDRIFSRAQFGDSVVLLLLTTGAFSAIEVEITSDSAIGMSGGFGVRALRPADFSSVHVFSAGNRIGLLYEEEVDAESGLLGIFAPFSLPLTLDARVDSPERNDACDEYTMSLETSLGSFGVNCVETWVMNGPPGSWIFSAMASANVLDAPRDGVWLLVADSSAI